MKSCDSGGYYYYYYYYYYCYYYYYYLHTINFNLDKLKKKIPQTSTISDAYK